MPPKVAILLPIGCHWFPRYARSVGIIATLRHATQPMAAAPVLLPPGNYPKDTHFVFSLGPLGHTMALFGHQGVGAGVNLDWKHSGQ